MYKKLFYIFIVLSVINITVTFLVIDLMKNYKSIFEHNNIPYNDDYYVE